MKVISTGSFKYSAELLTLRRSYTIVHPIFGGIIKDTDREVFPQASLHSLQNFNHKPRPVFQALRAILVLAFIPVTRHKSIAQVLRGAVYLQMVNPGLLVTLRRLYELFLNFFNLGNGCRNGVLTPE